MKCEVCVCLCVLLCQVSRQPGISEFAGNTLTSGINTTLIRKIQGYHRRYYHCRHSCVIAIAATAAAATAVPPQGAPVAPIAPPPSTSSRKQDVLVRVIYD